MVQPISQSEKESRLAALLSITNLRRKGVTKKTIVNVLERKAKEYAKGKGAVSVNERAIAFFEFLKPYDVEDSIGKNFVINPQKDILWANSGEKVRIYKWFALIWLYDLSESFANIAWKELEKRGDIPKSSLQDVLLEMKNLKGIPKETDPNLPPRCTFYISTDGDFFELSVKPKGTFPKKLPKVYNTSRGAMGAARQLLGQPIYWEMR